MLATEPLAIGDLILAEVLRGCRDERQFQDVRKKLAALELIVLGGEEVAVAAARHFRIPRRHGITARKTIDTLIATRCILGGPPLPHDDRDFDAFEAHLGLLVVRRGV